MDMAVEGMRLQKSRAFKLFRLSFYFLTFSACTYLWIVRPAYQATIATVVLVGVLAAFTWYSYSIRNIFWVPPHEKVSAQYGGPVVLKKKRKNRHASESRQDDIHDSGVQAPESISLEPAPASSGHHVILVRDQSFHSVVDTHNTVPQEDRRASGGWWPFGKDKDNKSDKQRLLTRNSSSSSSGALASNPLSTV